MPHPVPPVASPLSSSSRAGVKPRRGWSSEDEHHRLSWELSYLQMPSPPPSCCSYVCILGSTSLPPGTVCSLSFTGWGSRPLWRISRPPLISPALLGSLRHGA